jgi:class 3 adenylate cyclase
VLAAALALPWLAPLNALDLKWVDRQFAWLCQMAPIPASREVVIVGIDDETLRELGVPLSALHAHLGAALAALAQSRPLAVGLDIALPETSFDKVKPGLDIALARGLVQIKTVAPLVLGVTADSLGRPRPLHRPFAALAGEDGLGYVLQPRDADGALRRYDDRLGASGERVQTLPGQLARSLGAEPRTGLVNYALGAPLHYVPLQQLLRWAASDERQRLAETFGGRIVLIGGTFSFEDRHPVAVALAAWEPNERLVPGVAILAQQVLSLTEGRIVTDLPLPWLMLLLAVAAGFWWLPPGRYAVAGMLLFGAGAAAAGVWLLRIGIFVPVLAVIEAALLATAARAIYGATLGLREKRRLRAAFAGWVSPAVLREILEGRLAPGLSGVRRDVCVMFCDIRSFTALSETLPPEAVTGLLNRYFDRMARVIHEHGGTIDKFIGDGIMAFFGAPQVLAAPCEAAFAAARGMLETLNEFNRVRQEEGAAPIRCGVGLHYGPAVIGYVGAVERYEYTAIGDTVNTASRIEGLTRLLGYPLLVSRAVIDRLDRPPTLVALGQQAVKGRAAVEVFGWRPPEIAAQ